MYDFLKGLVILGIKTLGAFFCSFLVFGAIVFSKDYHRLIPGSIFDPDNMHILIHGVLTTLGVCAAFTPLFLGMMVLRPLGDAMEERIESDAEDILGFFGIYE